MRTATILLTALLVLGAVAVAPTASANHIACAPGPVQNTCGVVAQTGNAVIHYAECYLFTPPIFWTTCL